MAIRLPFRKRDATPEERDKFQSQVDALRKKGQKGDHIRVIKNEKTGKMRVMLTRPTQNFRRRRKKPVGKTKLA